MNENQRSTTETKNWGKEAESKVSNLFGRAQELAKDSSNYRLVIRRPKAKLLDIPVKLPVVMVGIAYLVLLWWWPVLLALMLTAALYYQVQVSFEPIVNRYNRDVDDVEYRRVD